MPNLSYTINNQTSVTVTSSSNGNTAKKESVDLNNRDSIDSSKHVGEQIEILQSEGQAWLTIEQLKFLTELDDAPLNEQLATIIVVTDDKGTKYYDAFDVLSLEIVKCQNHFAGFLRSNLDDIEKTLNRADIFRKRINCAEERSKIRHNSWKNLLYSSDSFYTYLNIFVAVGSTFIGLFKPSYEKGNKVGAIWYTAAELFLLGVFLYLQFIDNQQIINKLNNLHERLRLMHPDAYMQEQKGEIVVVTGQPKYDEIKKQCPSIISGGAFAAISVGTFFSHYDNTSRIFSATAPVVSSIINTLVNKRLNLELSMTKSIVYGEHDEEANLIVQRKL